MSASIRGDPFDNPPETWNHKRDGMVALSGDGVDDGALGSPHLFDVAPTVLATLGVPPSARMDGEALPVVEGRDPEEYPPFEAAETGEGPGSDVEERLSRLGYLEEDR